MNKKEGIKRQRRQSKRVRCWIGEGTHRFSLSLKKKKETAKNGNYSEKHGFFQMTGKYVKGEDKEGTEKGKSNQRESSKEEIHSKRTTWKRNEGKNTYSRKRTKNENVQKTDKNLHKKEKFGQKHRERTNMQKNHTNLWKMSKKRKDIWNMQKFQEEFFEMKD